VKKRIKSKRSDLRKFLRKAESCFERTFLATHQQNFLTLGQRSAELQAELSEMRDLLREIAEENISKVLHRNIRYKLRGIIQFCERHNTPSGFDMLALEDCVLELETEFAAIDASVQMLRSTAKLAELFSSKGK
jgi:predicted nuclease with TOPRIM domain